MTKRMTTKSKKEISHKTLDKKKDRMKFSARYTPIGTRIKNLMLVDKVIYPINICPHCKSHATFHRRVQENGDIIGNCWAGKKEKTKEGSVSMKFDYCLDCQRSFLIELYILKRKNKTKLR